jgi:hypothetical protein
MSSIALAKNPIKCTMPKDTVFVMVNIYYGPVGVIAAEDTIITVLEIKEGIENPEDSTKVKDVVRFSLSYDKPSIQCSDHGKDTFEMYAPYLASDDGLVFKDNLINCK